MSATVCEICGHEFGTTQAIPRVRPSETSQQALRSRRATLAALPWGVIGVAAVMLALAVGALVLLPQLSDLLPRSAQAAPTVTVEVIFNPSLIPVTPAAEAEAALLSPTETPTPSEPTATPLPSPTPLPPLEHVVESGETCSSIALRYGVSLDQLVRANRLDPSFCLIRVGDKLIIPRPTPTPEPTITYPPGVTPPPTSTPEPTPTLPPEITYVVQSGDTCGEIALKLGVPLSELIAQNKLDDTCIIRVGQELRLVFATATPAPTLTPFILQTPTPRNGYPAPVLIAPADGETIVDQPFVTLRWVTVGILQPDEWYVVQVQPAGAGLVPIFQTKATSLKLTTDILEGLAEREIIWWVQVRRREGTDPQTGAPIYIPLSPPSAPHRLLWRQTLSTPTSDQP